VVLSVAGSAPILTIFGMSTFAMPAVGETYLTGQRDVSEVNEALLGVPLIVTTLLGGLLYSTDAILFGVAVGRSGVLPKQAVVLYAPTGL